MNIIITLLVLGVIILIHELGHFLAAKFYKMPVSEFSIGMGPRLFAYHGEETDYSVRAIPIGGYVNIEGMDIENPVENGFNSKKASQRFVVLFAGVFMNFILALVIVFGLNFAQGGEYSISNSPIVDNVVEGSSAEGRILSGDRVLKINDKEIETWEDISATTSKAENSDVSVLVIRAGEELELYFPMNYNEKRGSYIMGIVPGLDFRAYTFSEIIKSSFDDYLSLFTGVFRGLKMIFSGEVKSRDMAGPVGLVRVVSSYTSDGVGVILMLVALLSVNIGILNLLPFPALDGGRIIFVLLELVGIEVNKKIEERIHYAGMIILLILIFLITINDIKNIFM
jgi:regulator of sigma E protease